MITTTSDPRLVAELLRSPHPQPVQIPSPLIDPTYFQFCFQRMVDLINNPDHVNWKLGDENDDGLIRKNPSAKNPTGDPKWIFHYKVRSFWSLAKKQNLDTHRYSNLLWACDSILDEATVAVLPYIKALDEQLPGYAFLRNFLAGNHVLRLIVDDPPATTGKLEVASEHTDFAFFTLHLWENRPELQWYNETTASWESVISESPTPTVTAFLGRKAALMTGGRRYVSPTGEQTKEVVPQSGLLRPLLHRVREIGTCEKLTTPRLAVVAFFHTPLVL